MEAALARTRIKICGVRDAATACAAVDAGADAVGLVFVAGSPRLVTQDQAESVAARLPAFVEPIALFADADPVTILKVAEPLGVRTVQLHGHETPEIARHLRPLRIIKALPFDADLPAALQTWKNVPNLVAILVDAPAPGGAAGGGGKAFDWNALATLRNQGAFGDSPALILAGGLNPGNVAHAIATVQPYAVDVSSGVERGRGIKDPALIRAFCAVVRSEPPR